MTLSDRIPLALHLFRRLHQLGIRAIHGVPGDFNLNLLDYIDDVPDLEWIGNCNELNAAYSADGYARVSSHPGALITTFGVGELSALNGVAGSMAERVPVVHIVGTTTRSAQQDRTIVHHSFGTGDHSTFKQISKFVCETQAVIDSPATATAEIDRCLETCVRASRPVYIFIPVDLVHAAVLNTLSTPLKTEIVSDIPANEDIAVRKIVETMRAAQRPVILADIFTSRFHAVSELRDFVRSSDLPTFATPLGKGLIDEDGSFTNYVGLYNGKVSRPGYQQFVEGSDCVVNVGALLSDSNTGGFSRRINENNVIFISEDRVTIKGQHIDGIRMKPVLSKLVSAIKGKTFNCETMTKFANGTHKDETPTGIITQKYLWPRVGEFLKENDVVLAESGTSNFGILDAQFPKNVTYIAQILWASIGYTIGATLGAALAVRESLLPNRRTILFVGDGSLQMSVQEISTMIKTGVNPIIFVLNNAGYSVERTIHGPEKYYNDINTNWQYQNLLPFFGAKKSRYHVVKTICEIDSLLVDPQFNSCDCIQLVEIVLQVMDIPWCLSKQVDQVLGEDRHSRKRKIEMIDK
ncbi:putative pyruvate decarboxylase [Neolecta irregularis DAH-3]|uniref:Putative pyruvate decarboxylase n=1 Tax=Neolecta irregularis (strain DAH-3) TaxID=1198029 RepID=A0A1U7LVW6_NEOID|nr:putative pyruvate decarboxylase [Neolecta irregularis DAH-3]|eukprot:OLL26820.1 putative pyruvate decarboxylase [Neolecta irregularis DAH-3]